MIGIAWHTSDLVPLHEKKHGVGGGGGGGGAAPSFNNHPANMTMGSKWATHFATGFHMGPIWVRPYAGCPDGFHITAQ